jgi:hypothetical protein
LERDTSRHAAPVRRKPNVELRGTLEYPGTRRNMRKPASCRGTERCPFERRVRLLNASMDVGTTRTARRMHSACRTPYRQHRRTRAPSICRPRDRRNGPEPREAQS